MGKVSVIVGSDGSRVEAGYQDINSDGSIDEGEKALALSALGEKINSLPKEKRLKMTPHFGSIEIEETAASRSVWEFLSGKGPKVTVKVFSGGPEWNSSMLKLFAPDEKKTTSSKAIVSPDDVQARDLAVKKVLESITGALDPNKKGGKGFQLTALNEDSAKQVVNYLKRKNRSSEAGLFKKTFKKLHDYEKLDPSFSRSGILTNKMIEKIGGTDKGSFLKEVAQVTQLTNEWYDQSGKGPTIVGNIQKKLNENGYSMPPLPKVECDKIIQALKDAGKTGEAKEFKKIYDILPISDEDLMLKNEGIDSSLKGFVGKFRDELTGNATVKDAKELYLNKIATFCNTVQWWSGGAS